MKSVYISQITKVWIQTKGSMRLTLKEANDLCDRVNPDSEGNYKTDDFIKILTT